MEDKYIILGSVDLNRPNTEVLFSGTLGECKKVNQLINEVEGICGNIEEELTAEEKKKAEAVLEFVTFVGDSPFGVDDEDYFPPVSSNGILKVEQVEG